MVTKGNRKAGKPIRIKNGIASHLERIALEAKSFSEDWLQSLIHNHPDLLPIKEIESSFSPLVSIGREVATVAGYIDNLYISPEGYLTIVETKLWRNPQARREVVSQILDYAKELSKWSYSDLDKSVVQYNQLFNKNSDNLLETIKKRTDVYETEEQLFIDSVSKNLNRARFLLLIVGDGIQEGVEDMVEYLSQSPQLHFTLGLVELQVFKDSHSADELIVIPQLITRTKEITRAIVRFEGTYSSDIKISVETAPAGEAGNQESQAYKRLTITAQDFFEQLEHNSGKEIVAFTEQIIKDFESLGLYIEWNTGSFSVKLPDPKGSGTKIGIANFDRGGLFYMAYSKGQFEKLQLPMDIAYSFCERTAALLPGIKQNPDKKHVWNKYSTIAHLKPVYSQFLEIVKQHIKSISSVEEKENGLPI